jgi:GTPase
MTFVAIKVILFYNYSFHFLSLGLFLLFIIVAIHNIHRFFASEIIRGALFTKLGKELPYCCEVRIDEFREPKPGDAKSVTRIRATVCVERESQKGIVVGKGGVKIKEIGVEAREKLEEFLQTKVFLNLDVKVDKDWRRDEKKLKAFGYLK